jgi:hypothetical protein
MQASIDFVLWRSVSLLMRTNWRALSKSLRSSISAVAVAVKIFLCGSNSRTAYRKWGTALLHFILTSDYGLLLETVVIRDPLSGVRQ